MVLGERNQAFPIFDALEGCIPPDTDFPKGSRRLDLLSP